MFPGVGVRYDQTHPSWLAYTEHGQFSNYLQLGNVKELNANGYIDETLETGKWFFNAGADLITFIFII